MALPHPDPGWTNSLLLRMPPRTRQLFERRGRVFEYELGFELCREAAELEHVYFPIDCVISQLSPGADPGVEVALIGYEGMLGSMLGLGVGICMLHTTVQHPGRALAVEASVFSKEFLHDRQVREVVGSYLSFQGTQMARTAYCNRTHQLEERLARWLLMMAERARSPRFPATHMFLGIMLGTRRPGVTLAAGALGERGLIRYRRGEIEILDPKGLEKQACSCYLYARQAYSRLFPPLEKKNKARRPKR